MTVPDLAKRHRVHLNQLHIWKKQAIDNLTSLFAHGAIASGDEEAHDREASQLYAKIGQLTVKQDSWPTGQVDEQAR